MRFLADESCDFAVVRALRAAGSASVVLIRYPTQARERLGADVMRLAERFSGRLLGAFVTLSPGRMRISHLPEQKG